LDDFSKEYDAVLLWASDASASIKSPTGVVIVQTGISFRKSSISVSLARTGACGESMAPETISGVDSPSPWCAMVVNRTM
jgi:hypothetical protein